MAAGRRVPGTESLRVIDMGVLHPRPGPHPVHTVHRVGAASIGVFLTVFAVLGINRGIPLITTEGVPVVGLSSNGLLAVISLLVGLMLIASAARGGQLASTISIVLGGLFLLSGLGNVLVLGTPMNMLAFQLSNVIFSLAVGAVLLIMGSYGRLTGALPLDNPYHHDVPEDPTPLTAKEYAERMHSRAAAAELADAERAHALHQATPEQERRLAQVNAYRSHDERRRAWQASG